MRCDLHVHTVHSGMAKVPVVRAFCRECYSPPEAVYERLKQLGMDLVTVTDHDSIDAAECLRRHPDFFLSEEVTCTMPSGTEAHLGVYDITERQHVEIQRRRDDLPRLLAYLHDQELFFALNHAFSSLTGRRDGDDLEWFRHAFPAFELLNGHIPNSNNQLAARFAELDGKASLAGSDAHTLASVGSAFTRVPGARSREEFFAGLRQRRASLHGDVGGYRKLTREVLGIAQELLKEKPHAWLLAPIVLAVPAVTMWIHLRELAFARTWRAKIENPPVKPGLTRGLGGAFRPREVGV